MATATVYANAANTDNIQSDGHSTYALVRAGNSLGLNGAGNGRVGQTLVAGPEYVVWEHLTEFDLTAYAGATGITSPVLSIAPESGDDSSATAWDIRVRDYDYGPAVAAGDYVDGSLLSVTGSLRAHFDTSSAWSPNDAYKAFADDAMAAAIASNVGGTLRLVIYSSRTESGTAPTGDEFVYLWDASGTYPPRLVFDYTAGGGGGSSASGMSLPSLRGLRSLTR